MSKSLLRCINFVPLLLSLARASFVRNDTETISPAELVSPITATLEDDFLRIALEVETDKVTTHSYHYIYAKYLKPVRHKALHMLEIGLGCNMAYGAGHSLKLWRRYLPQAKISFIEYDAVCASLHKDSIERIAEGNLYIGDQANKTFLQTVVAASELHHGFDVVIDDGGHTSAQMLTSLQVLWASLRPGGLYVVEDVDSNYRSEGAYGDSSGKTFMSKVHSAVDELHCRTKYHSPYISLEHTNEYTPAYTAFCRSAELDIVSVECMPDACLFIKGIPPPRNGQL